MANTSIVLILGVIASATLIISALSVHRGRLLTFSVTTSVLVVIQLLISHDPLSTVILCLVGIAQTTILLLAEKRYPWMNH